MIKRTLYFPSLWERDGKVSRSRSIRVAYFMVIWQWHRQIPSFTKTHEVSLSKFDGEFISQWVNAEIRPLAAVLT